MIKTEIKGIPLKFETNDKVFSPSDIDKGTLAMLSMVNFKDGDKVLDLGCGYGVVGVLAGSLIGTGKVIMSDISEDAVNLARDNAKLNGLENIRIVQSNGLDNIDEEDFDLILSNPPYHVDFSVPKNFIEKGFKKLSFGGRMYMVTKRKNWYKNKFNSVFGGVRVTEKDGYYVFSAEKRKQRIVEDDRKENHLSKKLQHKQDRRNNLRQSDKQI